jgi:hypothetical protein
VIEMQKGEKRGERERVSNMWGHVGPTLTQPSRRTKPGSKPSKGLKRTILLVEGRLVSGFAVRGRFCNSMTS